ncbi:MAG: type II toxin-antitoxin system VapC family toxin [Anaerolineales bacterium]|nr:type II toxin-antitoxin system VapC family toxin [Anaerolineales bacterium]
MRYLLDTHIWLWSLLEPTRLDDEVVILLIDENNELFISPISIWETLVLAEKGKIELYPTPQEWIANALEKSPVKEAVLTHAIAVKSRQIDLPHKDPADRFIAATALENGLTLITADLLLQQCKEIRTAQ